MPVVQHASTPAVARSATQSTSATVTTASFSPPAGAILLAMYGIEYKSRFSQTSHVTTWNATAGSSWRLTGSPYWDPPYPKQGQYSSFGNNVGIWVFNSANIRSVLTGATVTKVELYFSRRSDGGNSAPCNAYVWTHQIDSVDGADPSFANVQGVQTISGFSWGTAKWTTVSNTVGDNFKSGLAHSLALWDADGDDSDYSIWNDDCRIRITYTTTGATPVIAISDTGPNSWGSARNTQVDTLAYRGILSCWTQALGGAPGSITVTCTRSVDTTAAAMSLAVYVLTGQAASQAAAVIAHTILTSNVGCEATMNLQTGSLAYVRAALDSNSPALTKTANATDTDTWVDASDLVELYCGRLTTATGSAGNVTIGWTTTNTTAHKVFQGIEILSGTTVVTYSATGHGNDTISIVRGHNLYEAPHGADALAVTHMLNQAGAAVTTLVVVRELFQPAHATDSLALVRLPVAFYEGAAAADVLWTEPPQPIPFGVGATAPADAGTRNTAAAVSGSVTATTQADGQVRAKRVDVSGETTAVVQ